MLQTQATGRIRVRFLTAGLFRAVIAALILALISGADLNAEPRPMPGSTKALPNRSATPGKGSATLNGKSAPLTIEAIDTSEYPTLKVRVRGSFAPARPVTFTEFYRAGQWSLPVLGVLPFVKKSLPMPSGKGTLPDGRSRSTTRVTVLLVDSTRSMRRSDFRRARRLARSLVLAHKSGDRLALYSMNGRARLRADFGTDRRTILRALRRLRRNGRRTRIYDSLHRVIQRARAQVGPQHYARVILLTDGREEDSYLTVRDCARLARKGRVSVDSVLFGRRSRVGRLGRLADLTGGQLLKARRTARPVLVARLMRGSSAPQQRLIFHIRSRAAGAVFVRPNEPILLLASQGADRARGEYRLDMASLLPLYMESPLGWLILLGLAALVIGIVVAVAYAAQRSAAHQSTRPPPSEAEEVGAEDVVTADGPRPPLDDGLEPEVAAVSMMPAGAVAGPDGPTAYGATAVHARPSPADERAEARRTHMKNYAYRTLQNALREAESYERAGLVLRDVRRDVDRSEYDLFLERTVLGRGRWADIHVEDASVSEVHARIRRVDGRYVIYDLVSGSGTFLNGRRLLRPRALFDGDEIRIGRTYFRFRAM